MGGLGGMGGLAIGWSIFRVIAASTNKKTFKASSYKSMIACRGLSALIKQRGHLADRGVADGADDEFVRGVVRR